MVRIIPAARPFNLVHEPAAKAAVLCIHGYGGYPGELVSPAKALYEAGLDVYVPRLPGMGTDGEDFKRSCASQWLGHAEEQLGLLEERYGQVMLLGHSMGCLIALCLCESHEVKRQVLAMPAFKIPSLDPAALRGLLDQGIDDIPTEWHGDSRYHLHYEGAPCDDEELGREYYSHIRPRQLLEMEALRVRALTVMERLSTPTLILASESDSITDGTVCQDYADVASVRFIKGATHYVYYDIDPECEREALDATVAFLRQ